MRSEDYDKLVKGSKDETLSSRGQSIYYLGTFLFVSGIILLSLGTIFIIFFQIHYESESLVVRNTITYIGVGLVCLSLGINFMIRQKKRGYAISGLGTICSAAAAILFFLNYLNNWFYPIISYVLLLYIMGFLLLMGNAFGSVTVWLLQRNISPVIASAPKQQVEYTDEQIQRDIEEALKKDMQKAADALQLDLVDTRNYVVAHGSLGSETVVKVHDPMMESNQLKQTFNPGEREEWGSTGIDKASLKLSDALKEKPPQKTHFFRSFRKKSKK